MTDFRSHFDLAPGLIYLNSGSLSISPRPVVEAVERHGREYERNPTLALFETWERLWNVQKRVAAFWSARAQDLFLRPNVTWALNDFILGLPLAPGGDLAVTDLEYGAIVNICRLRAEREGRSLRTIRLPVGDELHPLTEEALAQTVCDQLGPETRLLLISHVVTGTGLRLPIARIAQETRRRGVILVVDGAHAPGALELDFRTLENVDFYAGNLHKWMMGPKGSGFGWVPERHHSSLAPVQAGWTTFEIPAPFARFGDGNAFAARLLMSSSQNFAPFYALDELLDFWEELGKDAIFARIRELQQLVEQEVDRHLGWRPLSPAAAHRGPLLAYDLPPHLQSLGYGLMQKLLLEHRVQLVTPQVRGVFRLRFAPHIYNSEDEIRKAVAILARL